MLLLMSWADTRGRMMIVGWNTASGSFTSAQLIKKPFCLASITEAGKRFDTSSPNAKTIEQMIMWAWEANAVHPADWILYCEEAAEVSEQIENQLWRWSFQQVVQGMAETVQLLYGLRFAKGIAKTYGRSEDQSAVQ